MRALIAGDQISTMCNDLVRRDSSTGARYHDRMNGFAPRIVRDPDDGDFRDGIVQQNRVLDFGRIDVFAAGYDHVLEAVDDVNEAFLIHVAAVAGMVPAPAQRLGA